MSYYNTCPECGAHLDPGEHCGCIPIMPSSGGTYALTDEDKRYIESKAVKGVISALDYISAYREILNR